MLTTALLAIDALAGVGILFLLRAIGERRYVGIFKRVRGTPFAKNDDRVFVPLCIFVGATAVFGAFSSVI